MKKTRSTTERDRSEAPLGATVIDLASYRDKRDAVKTVFKDSLDNSKVMERYNIEAPTIEQRIERIRNSIDRINKLMAENKG